MNRAMRLREKYPTFGSTCRKFINGRQVLEREYKTYAFQRPSTCPLGLLDTITVGFFDLVVVCVANVELDTQRNYLGEAYFFDLAITNLSGNVEYKAWSL
jgi:hypothetical protein